MRMQSAPHMVAIPNLHTTLCTISKDGNLGMVYGVLGALGLNLSYGNDCCSNITRQLVYFALFCGRKSPKITYD